MKARAKKGKDDMSMLVCIFDVTQKEKDYFASGGIGGMTEERYNENMVVAATDSKGNSAWCLMQKSLIEMVGRKYIEDHAELVWSAFLEDYTLKVSLNDYYNDDERFPPKIIDVFPADVICGTGEEVYRCRETEKYYIRQVASREPFAKWLACYKKQGRYEEYGEIRANVIFRCGDELEKVTYHDWNGNAAYKDTFNPAFGISKKKRTTRKGYEDYEEAGTQED